MIGSVALETDLAGMNLSRIDFGDDFVRVNLAGIWYANGQSSTLSFGLAPAAVPAPGAIGCSGWVSQAWRCTAAGDGVRRSRRIALDGPALARAPFVRGMGAAKSPSSVRRLAQASASRRIAPSWSAVRRPASSRSSIDTKPWIWPSTRVSVVGTPASRRRAA